MLVNQLFTTMENKFYRCRHCGNVAFKPVDSGVSLVCCGEKMELLREQSADSAFEKHLPVVTRLNEDTVRVVVGSVEHPMTKEHHISFICIDTEDGIQFVFPGAKPEAIFRTSSKLRAAYASCNLHGIWKTVMQH